MKKRTLISILTVFSVAAVFYLILQSNKKKNEEQVAIVAQRNADVAVRAAAVKREDMSGEFVVNGTFQANKQAEIAAEISGRVTAVYVEEGNYVKAGQTIARLAGDKQNVSVGNAQAVLSQAQSALSRYEAAYKTGGVTALQLDEARLQLNNARAHVQSAELESGDTKVISKISGIVNKKLVEVGTIVNHGTPIVEIVDISSLSLKVDVDQALVSQLSVGNIVKVKPDVISGALDGRITFIAPAASGALKFPVQISVANSQNKLKAGMYGTATFTRAGDGNVLTIPRSAFVGSVSDNQVFVVRNHRAYLTTIQSGINYGDKVEVMSGLKEGDIVVTSGQINLTDNTKVRIL